MKKTLDEETFRNLILEARELQTKESVTDFITKCLEEYELEDEKKIDFIDAIAVFMSSEWKENIIVSFANEFEGKNKADFIIKLQEYTTGRRFLAQKLQADVMKKYANDFEGATKVYFIGSIFKSLKSEYDTNLRKELIDEFQKGLNDSDKKQLIIEILKGDRLSNVNDVFAKYKLELEVKDILSLYNKNSQLKPKDITCLPIEKLEIFFKGIDADAKSILIRECLKDADNITKKAFVGNLLEIARNSDEKDFIFTCFLGSPDLEEKIDSYLKKSEAILGSEEIREYKILKRTIELSKQYNKELANIDGTIIEKIIELHEEYESRSIVPIELFEELTADIKIKCMEDLSNSLLKKEDLENMPRTIVIGRSEFIESGKEQEIPMYDITDSEYFLFVHTINAYSKMIDDSNNYSVEWNDKEVGNGGNGSLSTCAVSNVFSGHIHIPGHPILAFFDNVSPERILNATTTDSGTMHIDYNLYTTKFNNNYFTAKELMENCFDGYAEVTLFREASSLDELSFVGESRKLQPSAIMCYDKEPDSETKRAALEFNVPILYVDIERLAKKRREELNFEIQNPEIYENEESLENLINKIWSFSCGLTWLNYEEQKELINQNALADVIETTIKKVEQEMMHIKNIDAIDKCGKLLDTLSQKIAKIKKFTAGYSIHEAANRLEESTLEYDEVKQQIEQNQKESENRDISSFEVSEEVIEPGEVMVLEKETVIKEVDSENMVQEDSTVSEEAVVQGFEKRILSEDGRAKEDNNNLQLQEKIKKQEKAIEDVCDVENSKKEEVDMNQNDRKSIKRWMSRFGGWHSTMNNLAQDRKLKFEIIEVIKNAVKERFNKKQEKEL